MNDDRFTGKTAREIAGLVRAGEASAEEVVRAHLRRIEVLDPVFGAFQPIDHHAAVDDSRAVDGDSVRRDGPLAGVPVAIKDNVAVKGFPTRHGSAASSSVPATVDDECVRRLRAAGCVIIGKTRMPELAVWPFTESVAFGVTRNPWSPGRTAGGSTGGGAVAVATGMAVLALGSDGGGSIRVPAACCGIFGFKPPPGVVPLPGRSPSHWRGLSAMGPLARNVADAALMLDVIAGRAPRPAPSAPTATLRIALSTRPIVPGSRIDAETAAAVAKAGARLGEAGHRVVDAAPPYPVDGGFRFLRRWLPGIAADVRSLPDPSRLEPRTRRMARAGRVLQRLRLDAPVDREPLINTMKQWFDDHDIDLLLMPVLASPPVPNGRWTHGWIRTTIGVARWIQTAVWNLTGFPAAAVPIALSTQHLPLAVQLVAPPGNDDTLLAVAQQLGDLVPFPAWTP